MRTAILLAALLIGDAIRPKEVFGLSDSSVIIVGVFIIIFLAMDLIELYRKLR